MFSLIFGLIIGSFLNCLIWRLHVKESMKGRSHCRLCKKMIAWFDNIPLFSFLHLRGKCRHCQAKISWQYPLVEAATAILFAIAFFRITSIFGVVELWNWQAYLTLLRDWILLASLVVIFVTDSLWYLIFDEVVLPVSVVLAAINLALGVSWQNLLISVTIGSGFFITQFILSRGRWIGGGDIRLGLLLGAGLTWPLVVPAIFLAYILGALVGVGLLLAQKKQWGSMLPLGTFLAISAVITLFYGEGIIEWYLRLIHIH